MGRRWTDSEIQTLRKEYPRRNTEALADKLERSTKAVIHKARRLEVTKCDNYQILESLNKVERRDFEMESFGHFIAGFTAGEGSFVISERDDRRDRFSFQIALEANDRQILEDIEDYFGVGAVREYESRDKNWQAEVQYAVQNVGQLVKVIIPFFELYPLHDTLKREQYQGWKTALYEEYEIPEEHRM